MFLLRLIHLIGFKPIEDFRNDKTRIDTQENKEQKNISLQILDKETVNQIKNVAQEKKIKPQAQIKAKITNEITIKSLNELIDLCNKKREMKLKYELEKNVNIVKFENGRIEISFNDNLEKDFVKDLSVKLLEWTNKRWIISFSKKQGEISIKEKELIKQKESIENAKKTDLYKTMLDFFPDAELTEVKPLQKEDD